MALSKTWKKSTRSGGSGACVEARREGVATVGVRDSKDPSGPQLRFAATSWTRMLAGLKSDTIR